MRVNRVVAVVVVPHDMVEVHRLGHARHLDLHDHRSPIVQEGGVDWGAVDVAALETQALEKARAEAKQKAAKRVMF